MLQAPIACVAPGGGESVAVRRRQQQDGGRLGWMYHPPFVQHRCPGDVGAARRSAVGVAPAAVPRLRVWEPGHGNEYDDPCEECDESEHGALLLSYYTHVQFRRTYDGPNDNRRIRV